MKIRYKQIKDMTGKFPHEIPTSRNEGETQQAYRARRISHKMQLNGYWDKSRASALRPRGVYIRGYKDGR